MALSFNSIPAVIRNPGTYVEFDGSTARTAPSGKPQQILVLGQKRASGTATADIPVLVSSDAEAISLFGVDSQLTDSLKAVFATNSFNTVYACPQADNGAGVARVVKLDYALTYTVAAAKSGVEKVYIGETVYQLSVAVGDTAATVAAGMAALITADSSALFTAVAAAGAVNLTAKAKGEVANGIEIASHFWDSDSLPPSGAWVTPSETAAGSVNPDITGSLASLGSLDFTHVVLPYNDASNYAKLLAEAQSRWAPLPSSGMLGTGQNDFMVFYAYRGSESAYNTFKASRNSQYFTGLIVEPSQVVNGVTYCGALSPSYKFAAAYAALSAYLVSVVANNPHQNRELSCLTGAPRAVQFDWNTRERLGKAGASTYYYNASGQVLLASGYTEYTKNALGIADDSEIRVETQFAKSYVRWSVRSMLEARFPSHRLADDQAGLPDNVATPKLIKASLVALAKSWRDAGIVENLEAFISSLVVERSTQDCNTIKFRIRPDLVNVLTVKAGQVQYIVC